MSVEQRWRLLKRTRRVIGPDTRHDLITSSRIGRIASNHSWSRIDAFALANLDELARLTIINGRNRKHNPDKSYVTSPEDVRAAASDMGLEVPQTLLGGTGIKSERTRSYKDAPPASQPEPVAAAEDENDDDDEQ